MNQPRLRYLQNWFLGWLPNQASSQCMFFYIIRNFHIRKSYWKSQKNENYIWNKQVSDIKMAAVRVQNMFSTMCASSMYSRICMKMSSFLYVHAWSMVCILYLSCGIPFQVWTPDNISGLMSVVVWLSRWQVINEKSRQEGGTKK